MDQKLLVTDRTDNNRYPAKVLNVNEEKNQIKIHFIDWNNKYDEWLPCNSDRIHSAEDNSEQDDSFCDSREVGSVGAAIGRLLLSVGLDSRRIVSTFDVRQSFKENCKGLGKFKVPELETCALALNIKIKEDDKKLYNKLSLTECIVSKIKSHLPQDCASCKEEYTVQLEEVPIFTCYQCRTPSHSCEDLQSVRSLFPNDLPIGFVWLCSMCLKLQVPTLKPVALSDDAEAVNEKDEAADGKGENAKSCVKKPEDPSKTKDLCKYFIRKKCKHGAKGIGCSFAHPQKCFKFLRHGTKARGGL